MRSTKKTSSKVIIKTKHYSCNQMSSTVDR